MKVSTTFLDIFLLVFSMFSIPLPHMLYLTLRYAALGYLFIKYAMKEVRHNHLLYFLIAGYGITVLFSSFYNKMDAGSITSALGYVIQIADIYLIMCSSRKKFHRNIKYLFQILLGYAVITDVLIFILPYDASLPAVEYFVGTKFTVSYLHCLLICLYEYRRMNEESQNKYVFYVLWGVSLFITRLVNCATGTIMCLAILLMHFFPSRIWKILCSWQAVAILSGLMLLFIFGEMTILNNERLLGFITGLFQRNVNLTGRTVIFRYLPLVILQKPLIGYGYYNTVIADYMGTVGANPQNGFMKIIVDSGFIGLAFYAGLMLVSIRRGQRISKKGYPLFMFLYAMLLASSMEINLTGSLFYLSMALIFACSELEGSCDVARVQKKRKRPKVRFAHIAYRSDLY